MTAGTLAIVLAACAGANFSKPSLALEVQSAVVSGNVNVQLIDGTAILTGLVPSRSDSLAAERAARRYEGVDRVINRLFVRR